MITFYCFDCGMKFQVKDEFAGRSTHCPTCKAPLQVPQPQRIEANVPVAQVIESTNASERAGSLASATVAYDGSDKPVADLIDHGGQSRGRYLIDREIARGGMGAVLRGIDRDIRREIAVKVMLDDANAGKKARFVEEAQITGQLEHPNIVPVHELGLDEQGRPYFTMKLVKGRSLADVLKHLASDPRAEEEWPLGRLLTILVNVCHALSYAHSRNVIHRDLKPANIMVGDFGEVYVMDWGLAKVLSEKQSVASAALAGTSTTARVSTSRPEESDLTQDGSILGTPAYMAPEQATGRIDAIDERSDIYALGGLLYAILTLKPPVETEGGQAKVLARVAQGEIIPPEQRTPTRGIPPELSAIAMKALTRDPRDRYRRAERLRQDVERYLTGHSVSARRDSFREQAWKLIKRNKGVSIATASALVVLLVVVGFFLRINYTARVQAEGNYQAFLDEKERRKESIPSFLTASRLLLKQRDYDGAGVQVGLVLELEPEQVEARLLRGELAVMRQDFTAARPDLRAVARSRPNDLLVKDLLGVMSRFKAREDTTALILAEVFNRHQAFPLADGAVRVLGGDAPAVRKGLLTLYRTQIEKAWPGTGKSLTWVPERGLSLSLGSLDIAELVPLRGIPLTSLDIGSNPKIRDLSPLAGMPLTTLNCRSTQVSDLSPLAGMKLTSLNCYATQVTDLSPLAGMPLTTVNCGHTKVADLSPLKGMALTTLNCCYTTVSDLSPLAGMKLTLLVCHSNNISDLSPLAGMPLTTLNCRSTQVSDLSPLARMPLATLSCYATKVADLSPLKGMPLTSLNCYATQVTDLTPLEGLKLTILYITPAHITRGLDVVRSMPSLQTLSPDGSKTYPAAEFWKRYDAEEFK